MTSPIKIRNVYTAKLYDGPLTDDFYSEIGDFREMAIGFIQAIYSDIDSNLGEFKLLVSLEKGPETFAVLSSSEQTMGGTCNSVAWNLVAMGYRFIKIQYTANGGSTGNVRIIAIGKKGG